MRIVLTLLAVLFAMSGAAAAELTCAQIRIVVPFPAGGAADVSARLIAERLERAVRRPVVIENRSGATGNIGTTAVATAPADGCTLLNNAAVIATFLTSFTKLAYHPINDLVPVGGIGITPTLLVTASSNPVNDIKGLLQWGKDKPNGLTFSTAGYGLLQHLAVEEIAVRTGVKVTHVAYRGGAQAVADLVAARVDLGSFAGGSVLPLVREGKLRAIGVVAERRSALVPEVRTTGEQGLPGLDAGVHFMLYAPAKTPKPVIDLLSAELKKIVADPALKERFVAIGFDPTPASSEEMAAVMRKTAETWAPLIKRLNIKLD
jgi:tripartite-type tricarboxylate transporter receptor subunit TctC